MIRLESIPTVYKHILNFMGATIYHKKKMLELGMAVHDCNPSTPVAEREGFKI
jgi:hypothetical protein